MWRRLIEVVDTHTSSGEFGIPAPEELAARSDEDMESILAKAARDMQAAAVPCLERLAAGGDHRIALAAARALGEVRDGAAAEALVRIRDVADSKGVRKEAGRSLQRLKSAGVHPAFGPGAAARHAPLVSVPAGKVEGAFAGYYDRMGTRLLATQVWAPARGRAFIMWILSENVGIDDCRVYQGSKRALREWTLNSMNELRLVEIDAEHARFLLKEAADARREAGKEMPQGYAVYGEAVKNMPPAPTRPIIYEKLNADEIRSDASALRDSRRLLSLQFACPWDLGEEAIKPFREKVLTAATSVIYTSSAVRSERVRGIVEEAMTAVFTPEVAERYRRRLEETAYLLLLGSRDKPARSALAAALAIADGKPLRDIPFVQALVEKSIGVARRGSREAERLRRLKAERERLRLVRPLFEPAAAEGIIDGALLEGEEDGWEHGLDQEWEGDSYEGQEGDWQEEGAGTGQGRDDRGDDGRPLIIIDPRDPRQVR